MSKIQTNAPGLPPLPQTMTPAPLPGPVGPSAALDTTDIGGAGLEALAAQLRSVYGQLQAAVGRGDVGAAQALALKVKPLVERGLAIPNNPYAEPFARVGAAADQVLAALAEGPAGAAPAREKKTVFVGLPGRAGRAVEVDAAPVEHKGPLGFFGKFMGRAGSLLEKAGHVVFFPLELAGKVLDPVRKGLGNVLGSLRHGIDNTLGKIPLLGSAVRFTTGFVSGVVGLVDGAIQGITHPVELVKGLGHMLWTVSGLVPGPRMLWDAAVNGVSPIQSLKNSWGEGGAILGAFFSGAMEDAKNGNWAGALGRVTADVGSFFVGGGAPGVGKIAAAGGKVAELAQASRFAGTFAKVGELAKTARVAEIAGAGGKLLDVGIQASGKIFELGFKGNFAAWRKAGDVASHLPGANRVVALGETVAEKVVPRLKPQGKAPSVATEAEVVKGERAVAEAKGAQAQAAEAQVATGAADAAKAQPSLEFVEVRRRSASKSEAAGHDVIEDGWQVYGKREDGRYVMLKGKSVATATAEELLKMNPELRLANFFSIGGKADNGRMLETLIGEGVQAPGGTAAQIPRSSGRGHWIQGKVFGRSPDGEILAYRPSVRDVRGELVQAGGANLIPLEKFLAANPELVAGKRLGTLDGHVLSVHSFDGTHFRLTYPDGHGNFLNAGLITPEALAKAVKESGSLDHLPLSKLGIDGNAHLLEDPVLGMGNGGIAAKSHDVRMAIQEWFFKDRKLQDNTFKAIAADPQAVEAIRNWKNLSQTEQVRLAKYVADQQGFTYGFLPVKIEVVDHFPNPNTLGQFLPETNVMQVRADQLASPEKFLNTVYHEQLHGYQYQTIQKYRAGELAAGDPLTHIAKEWSENWDTYRNAEQHGYADYFTQPVESHSFAGGNAFENFVHDLRQPKMPTEGRGLGGRLRAFMGL